MEKINLPTISTVIINRNGDLKISGDAIDAARAQVSQSGITVNANTNGFVNNTEADNLSVTAGGSFVGDSFFFGFSGNIVDMRVPDPNPG